jgi:hypothetical protein
MSWRWLASTRQLQVEAYHDLDWPKQGEALAVSAQMNYAACTIELAEAMAEVGWKPWASDRGWVNRDAFIGELVDAAHFLANMLIAVGCTDYEWERRYQEKQALNLQRQQEGYTGRNKCPACGRAYVDPTTTCRPGVCEDHSVNAAEDATWD